MKHSPIYLGIAKDEITDAYDYYESVQTGRGDQFLKEFEKTIETVLQYPYMYQLVHADKRRAILKKFSHHIIYEVFENDRIVLVLGVVHSGMNPKRWIKR